MCVYYVQCSNYTVHIFISTLSVFSQQDYLEECASTVDCIWAALQIFRMDPEHVKTQGMKGFVVTRWRGKVASELQLGIFIFFLIYWCMWKLTPC